MDAMTVLVLAAGIFLSVSLVLAGHEFIERRRLWHATVMEGEFRRCVGEAQTRWMELGPHHPETQNATLSAIKAWRAWQGRESVPRDVRRWKPADWDVFSLSQSLATETVS